MATTISNALELTRKGSFVNLTNGLRERCGGELKEGKSEGREPLTSRFVPSLFPKNRVVHLRNIFTTNRSKCAWI